ncbi:SGNH/GDSL hydrolase family protein [Paenibacillus sp. GXUN7292]|uniref:SGNH/GDSL hydrolase family protein n=1 Tax=Paenibacillus sp. GXUN7292 TaxID=3422499 RepID=UPI003D7D8E0D
MRLAVYGDSIAQGANASGKADASPYMPSWAELLSWQMGEQYGINVDYVNLSKGGMQSDWGVEHANQVADTVPDLTTIAFGMNDGTSGRSAKEFAANISLIMDTIKKANPQAEFILVSPMLANPETFFNGKQAEYAAVLQQMEKQGCVIVDMTRLHTQLLERKKYSDLTGNHINHPNDFLSRLYALAIAAVWR